MITTLDSDRHPLYADMLSIAELVFVLRFLAEVRHTFSIKGIETALTVLYDGVHGLMGEGKIHILIRLTYLVRCDEEYIDIAIGVLSSSNPMKAKFLSHWLMLRERSAVVLRELGEDPERTLPGK